MFDSKDILARLQAGERIEDIAQSAADALNEAKAEFDRAEKERKAREEAERKAKEEAAKKAALVQKRKENYAASIIDGLFDYLTEFHPGFLAPDEIADFHNKFSAEHLSTAIDETVNALRAIPSVEEALRKSQNATVKLTGDEAKQAEDAINKFLRENNLF